MAPKKAGWGLGIVFWLVISVPGVLVFLAMLILPLYQTHPLSYFDRRNPTTCPGYYDRHDDELLACIHRANEAQFNWMATRLPVESALGSAPWLLAPFWIPLALWFSVRLFRRARRSISSREPAIAQSVALGFNMADMA
jgi:hypothetical protein